MVNLGFWEKMVGGLVKGLNDNREDLFF